MPQKTLIEGKIEIAPHILESTYTFSPSRSGHDFLFLCGYEKCAFNYKLSRTSFPYLILEMIVSGSGKLTIDGKTIALEAGHCFYTGLNKPFVLESDNRAPLEKYFIAFGEGSWARRLSNQLPHPGVIYLCKEVELIRKWNQLILDECSAQNEDAPENATALINILFRKLAPYAENSPPVKRSDALVHKAIKEIDKNFHNLCSIQDLADKLSVSCEHLCRNFKRAGRSTPYKILTRRKMEHAYAQLKLSHLTIQEIALELGFSDAFHFSRSFKSHYGCPPSHIRLN